MDNNKWIKKIILFDIVSNIFLTFGIFKFFRFVFSFLYLAIFHWKDGMVQDEFLGAYTA